MKKIYCNPKEYELLSEDEKQYFKTLTIEDYARNYNILRIMAGM